MNIKIQKSKIVNPNSVIQITGSKSESNRLLILQALYPELQIENLSNSDDTKLMRSALYNLSDVNDVNHAGTAMRFLTAYFSILKNREVIITGSPRMKERPIKILVEALHDLGAQIDYLEKKGFPPLKIKGGELNNNKVILKANVSSQYISALLLIAPKLKNGLELSLEGEIVSMPYIKMTLELLRKIGVKTSFENNIISVEYKSKIENHKLVIESDWSSASYFYSCIALSDLNTELVLSSFKNKSLQGDAVLAEIYKEFGVETTFLKNSILLKKRKRTLSALNLDLVNSPDIAQTIVITCLGLGVACNLTGLHTLKIKETDRLLALKAEIEKLGGKVKITNHSLQLFASETINPNIKISTYNDHRMAMAFAPLALKTSIEIKDAKVISKSYPTYWNDLKAIGFKIT